MVKCRACNNESEHDLCSEKCISIMDDAKGRIMQQNSLFDMLIDNAVKLKCKDCGGERKKYTQYCNPCATRRDRERKREYEAKKRASKPKPRCLNKDCNKILVNKTSNGQKYCNDDCKPSSKAAERARRWREKEKERKLLELANYDKYEGTVPKQWIQPRGSKKRKEMGLEYTKYGLGKDSDTGGAFIY